MGEVAVGDVRTSPCAELAAELRLEEHFPDRFGAVARCGGGRRRASRLLVRRTIVAVGIHRPDAVVVIFRGPDGGIAEIREPILRRRVVCGYHVNYISARITPVTHPL